MRYISLITFLVLTALLFQNCKKSSDDTTTDTSSLNKLSATINGISWIPDTLSAKLVYHSATKTKTFSFSGTIAQKRVECSVTVSNATNSNSFPTSAGYTVDATGNPSMVYSTQQKVSGNYVFVPVMTAAQNDGYLYISAMDATNNNITGTFYFNSRVVNYDSNGNITSVVNTAVSSGSFYSMPYTYTTD